MDLNALFKKYDPLILSYARKLDSEDYDDYAQEIRIYILEHIHKFDPTQSSLGYYLKMCAKTAFRRLVFDVGKQGKFERAFDKLEDNMAVEIELNDTYDEFIQQIIERLTESQKIVFYSILYTPGKIKYNKLAKKLGIRYETFSKILKEVKVIIQQVVEENKTFNRTVNSRSDNKAQAS